MAKTKTKKIIHAGSLVVEAIYPRVTAADRGKVRSAKRKASSEAQARMNRIYSYQKLELMLAANFRPGDLVVTLTSDDAHLPRDRQQASAQLKYFRSQLNKLRSSKKQELRMIWSTESRHGDGRWHHHLVLNSTGDDYDAIRRLWIYGDNLEIKPLKIAGEKSYASLAKYMAKEQRERIGLRSWSYSRSCKKPEIETFAVEADTSLRAPKGSFVLSEKTERTEYSYYRILKYLAPGWDRPQKRRRRK